ncbi:MAG: hypothetical protein HY540_00010 [Deltaproteobacteria bacterium]|nr:hypothetical protein [Deltaproteobacteria bacterium]
MQSWQQIQKQYPNEHVVIANPQSSEVTPAVVESGNVVDHDSDLDHLLNRCDLSKYDRCAVIYTGDLGALIGERGMIRVVGDD